MKMRRRGFTLIELLVVVSIIAVLLGLLLPALGEAKRQARFMKDVANISQNAKAIGIYSAQNRGRMPNIPPGNGQNNTGQPGRPALGWAGIPFGGGGSSLMGLDLGSPLAHNGWAIPPGLNFDDVWKMHHIAFGDYVIDDAGANLLHEVFVSPGAQEILGRWDDFKAGELRSPDGDLLEWPTDFFLNGAGAGAGVAMSAWVGPLDNFAQVAEGAPPSSQHFVWMLQGSYRYTLAGLYQTPTFIPPPNPTPGMANEFFSLNSLQAQMSPAFNPNQISFFHYRSYVQVSDAVSPSEKVAFWDFWASNSPGARYYFEPKAEIAAGMVDGSARRVRPMDETPNGSEASAALARREGFGTRNVYWPRTGHPSKWDFNDDGGIQNPSDVHPILGPYAWFAHTYGGLRGRDLK